MFDRYNYIQCFWRVLFKQELIENIINKINSAMNNRTNGKEFSIVRFQPGNILLYHKSSKKTFEYVEQASGTPLMPNILHPALIRPIVYNNGLLYPRGLSTLQTELENRRRAHTPLTFDESEIMNTFAPLLECLLFLHSRGVVHGCVCPKSIIVTEEEDVKMKDWMVGEREAIYYGGKLKGQVGLDQDLAAMGHIMAQAATLKRGAKVFGERELNQVLEGLIDRYSKGFIFGLAVLLRRNRQRFQHILHYFRNEEKYLGDIQLNSLYELLKKERDNKRPLLTNQNTLLNTFNLKAISSLTDSPIKKTTPSGSLNNTIKRTKEDENKKVFNEETKRKQIQKINKIIERSNDFVNELMARKNNEQILKKIAPKPNITANISMYTQAKKLTKDGIQSSPTKRIRASSKKK